MNLYLGLKLLVLITALLGIFFLCHLYWQRKVLVLLKRLKSSIEGEINVKIFSNSKIRPVFQEIISYIEEIKNSNNLCKKELTKLSSIIENLNEGIVWLDSDQKVVYANPAASRILNFNIVPPLMVSEVIRDSLILDAIKNRKNTVLEYEIFWPIPKIVRVHVIPFEDYGWALILEDVTSIKKLTKVRREFVSNITHELRTPLTAIAGYAENLLYEDLQNKELIHKQISIILRHAKRLTNLINDLHLLSRLETQGIPESEMDFLALQEVISAAIEAIAPQAKNKNLQIHFEKLSSPALVRGNFDLLVQAVLNILDNSVKFSPEGEKIFIMLCDEENHFIILVRDQGPGIPRSEQERIFERFYQGSKRHKGGSGLGLAITKHIVLAHQGRIDVESEPGLGACFKIYLPKVSLPA